MWWVLRSLMPVPKNNLQKKGMPARLLLIESKWEA